MDDPLLWSFCVNETEFFEAILLPKTQQSSVCRLIIHNPTSCEANFRQCKGGDASEEGQTGA